MAVNVIGNQLVKLFSTDDFNTRNDKCTWDTRTYCQVVREEQTTMFQIQVTPQDDVDILGAGDFDTVNPLTVWEIESNAFTVVGGGKAVGLVAADSRDSTAILNQTIDPLALKSGQTAVDEQSYYCIEFNIDSITGPPSQVGVGISGEPNAANNNGIIVNTTGTHRLYWKSLTSNKVTVSLSITSFTTGATVVFDYIHFVKLTTPIVTIEDLSGVTKRTLTPFAQEQDRINYAIDWLGLPFTSYRVCITGVDDLTFNYLDFALALGTEGGAAIELEEGGFLKWYG